MSIETMKPRHGAVERSRDRSQPLSNLGPDETLKAESNHLRGGIADGLLDEISGGVAFRDQKLLKFHGIYQQDDRDLRDERRRQKLEPAHCFMVRVRLPGGVCTPAQWVKLDKLARAHGGETLRLTTRQTFQFHWILKRDLKATIQGLREALLDTVAACGDDTRGVMCAVNPALSSLHAEVYDAARDASNHATWKSGAYHEIWYGERKVASSETEEPFYGNTYLPRKFKIGFVIPPSNDIDVYAQDLGFIAIAKGRTLEGYNVAIGGSMGRTDGKPETYPRLASVIGFIPADKVIETIDAVMSVQRDYGDRKDRSHARFKYTIDDKGLDWIKAEIETRLGFSLAPQRTFTFTSNGDVLGWSESEDGRSQYTLFIENGRIANHPGMALMDAILTIAKIHDGTFRLTPNQNLAIADVSRERRPVIQSLLEEFGLDGQAGASALRRNSMACVALPTCGLAMAESERYLPGLISRIETILARYDLMEEPITLRMTGCPNGCARPYIAEIGLTGRAPGKYNLYIGGGFHGERLNRLHRENIGETAILNELDTLFAQFAAGRQPGEHFGDYVMRAGIVA
ncbi:NADPH-dependent assimilatory sulfite reductase hemoprotein subunit [Vineibacter terrae]|uniref:Sulfite reductase [NADPH] hemoprotein beta-component n=1 Tax=Vineibacter terrae TaxID=2586908 RepID=A0A5C8PQC8_9HYPH|nr:NADPH-dependent assimilatory sulfite reductase hemoprotein subunit [Vineibacter terrae]TXL76798.1 NADPH-dependent assimilatory sulfite reductase hemoprotein subunit [Vineibacter terrae]